MSDVDDRKLQDEASEWARQHGQQLITNFAGDDKFIAKDQAITVFMAGSPGAGKTETSKALISTFSTSEVVREVIRIDPDDIRDMLPQYTGGNAHLFQQAISIGADKIYNHAIKTNKHILLDGTFSNFDRANQNVTKSLKKKRLVYILYIYTDPLLAWQFTQARELKEGRKIRKQDFIKEFFAAKEVVVKIKEKYGSRVRLSVLLHNYEEKKVDFYENVDTVDKYVMIRHTPSELEKLL